MTATNANAICPRCAKRFTPCEPWRVGCPVCGNILQTATREAAASTLPALIVQHRPRHLV